MPGLLRIFGPGTLVPRLLGIFTPGTMVVMSGRTSPELSTDFLLEMFGLGLW